jgi:hypothetical protein
MVKAMMKPGKDQDQVQLESTEKMKSFQSMIGIKAQKSFNSKKKGIFESSVTSILAYLQAPIDL